MKIPKKFQNEYRRATHEGVTYHVGDTVRSFGAKGTILKVAASGAYVAFSGYELDVAWDEMKLTSQSEQNSTPERHERAPRASGRSTRGVIKSRTDSDCEALLARERSELLKKDETIRELEHTIAELRQENDTLQIECREDKGSDVSVSPEGKVVAPSNADNETPLYEIAGGKAAAIEKSLREKDTVILIAPRDLSFDEIDVSRNVRVVYPVSRSIRWIASDAWRRGYRDAEYTIYQYVQREGYTYQYSIDKNQTVEQITEIEKPKSPPIEVRSTDSCRVEIVSIKGKDTVRIVFEGVPSAATIKSVKQHGFRYYNEKGTDSKYWGAFFTSEKLRFAKELCGDDNTEREPQEPKVPFERKADSHIIIARPPAYEFNERATSAPESATPYIDETDLIEAGEDNAPNTTDLDIAESSMNNIEALLREALKK